MDTPFWHIPALVLEMQCAIAFAPGALGPLFVEIVIRLIEQHRDATGDWVAAWIARFLSRH